MFCEMLVCTEMQEQQNLVKQHENSGLFQILKHKFILSLQHQFITVSSENKKSMKEEITLIINTTIS